MTFRACQVNQVTPPCPANATVNIMDNRVISSRDTGVVSWTLLHSADSIHVLVACQKCVLHAAHTSSFMSCVVQERYLNALELGTQGPPNPYPKRLRDILQKMTREAQSSKAVPVHAGPTLMTENPA